MLEGLMQHDFPLTTQTVLRRMRTVGAAGRAVTLEGDGVSSASYAEVGSRIDRLCAALAGLGVGPGDRVATFSWNNQQHLELYLGVPCMGAVLHTLNIRLFPEQLTYVANHAEDKVVVVDGSLVPLIAKVAGALEKFAEQLAAASGNR